MRTFGCWLLIIGLLIGCTAPTTVPAPPDIAKGTDALTIDLRATNPELIMCQQTDLVATLRNLGTTNIERGLYTFIIEDQVLKPVTGTNRKKLFDLEGRSQYNPQGGIEQTTLKVKNTALPPQIETYQTPIILQACYQYETLASAPICIDPDVLGKNPAKPCTVAPVSVGGQGAPVAVTRIEPTMAPAGNDIRPTFTIYLQNLGSGRVVSAPDVESACTTTTTTLNPTVEIAAFLQNRPLRCTQREVRLEQGKEARIACESEQTYGPAQGTFSSILEVEITYGYINTASQSLTINRLPGQERCPP
ncbi:hypothetical protein C4580_06345 [Candidatus Woesearchaeota archaeon]|nr:MAG: hypothetical protein C4580_06345 [Candidatus Woesearchaeota archaeon]